VCGSVGSIGHWAKSLEMTDRLSWAICSIGLISFGGQKVSVYNTPMILANLLQKELWSSACPGVYH